MNRGVLSILLGFALVLGGCGNSNSTNAGSINGNWSATLTNTDSTPAFAFTTTFTQMTGNSVNVTNLTFTTASPCFVSGETETASRFPVCEETTRPSASSVAVRCRPSGVVESRSDVTIQATATHFHVLIELAVTANGVLHHARQWTESVERVLL